MSLPSPLPLLVLAILAPALASAALPPGYRLANAYDDAEHGTRIELLLDRALTDEKLDTAWGTGEFGPVQPRKAVLRAVSAAGAVLATLALDGPLARIEWQGNVAHEPLRVTVDFSSGMGSYSGPATRWVQLQGGRLVWAQVLHSDGHRATLQLAATLKTAWRRRRRPDGSLDLLAVACRPVFKDNDQGEPEFTLTLTRYHFDGAAWTCRARTRKGFWEDEEGSFPADADFPKL